MRRLIPIFVLAFSVCSLAQTRPQPDLIEESVNRLCSEEVKAIVDNFFIYLNKSPGSTGYIIGSPDKNIEGRYSHYDSLIRRAIAFRKYPIERVTIIRAAPTDLMRFQYWIVPPGANSPTVERAEEHLTQSATLFDKSSEISYSRKRINYGGEDEPCDFGLNFDGYAAKIRSEPGVYSYLIAFSDHDSSKRAAIKWLGSTSSELAHRYKIPRTRIRTYYGGRAKSSQMQIWLVPERSTFTLSLARKQLSLR